MKRLLGALFLYPLAACAPATERDDRAQGTQGPSAVAMSHELGPYFHVETQMHDRIRAAVGASPADSWARMMIEHHRGEIAMARRLLQVTSAAEARSLANATIAETLADMEQLEELVGSGQPDYESAAIFLPAIDRMHDAMMAVPPEDPVEDWMLKMLHHHQGAVEMADLLLAGDKLPGPARQLAETTRDQQLAGMQQLRMLLAARTSP
jgi:uncharacterized protein (DUF305 family)